MSSKILMGLTIYSTIGLVSCQASQTPVKADVCSTNRVVLGTAQDAGKPPNRQ